MLTYWGDTGKAHLETGVTADSQQGSMQSRTLDVFLTPAASPKPASGTTASAKPAGQQPPSEGRQLDHALALGVSQSARPTAAAPPTRPNTPLQTENSSFPAANPPSLMLPPTQLPAIR